MRLSSILSGLIVLGAASTASAINGKEACEAAGGVWLSGLGDATFCMLPLEPDDSKVCLDTLDIQEPVFCSPNIAGGVDDWTCANGNLSLDHTGLVAGNDAGSGILVEDEVVYTCTLDENAPPISPRERQRRRRQSTADAKARFLRTQLEGMSRMLNQLTLEASYQFDLADRALNLLLEGMQNEQVICGKVKLGQRALTRAHDAIDCLKACAASNSEQLQLCVSRCDVPARPHGAVAECELAERDAAVTEVEACFNSSRSNRSGIL